MSVGSKIRYNRRLRKMTQRELGVKAGFPESNADVRIRQYEQDKMKPKKEILNRIAEALDVNPAALVAADFHNSPDELIHTLFDLEREHGLHVEKQEDGYVLRFNKDSDIADIMDIALAEWYNAYEKLFMRWRENGSSVRDYNLWTQEYRCNYPIE